MISILKFQIEEFIYKFMWKAGCSDESNLSQKLQDMTAASTFLKNYNCKYLEYVAINQLHFKIIRQDYSKISYDPAETQMLFTRVTFTITDYVRILMCPSWLPE